ncbi:hypothetical protein K435DRAFT_838113 [Dendrothele bispora CBS 962.96]|uniref:DUF6534 domain-containing protein n=1 Tax=Dendrothele bispora (strain CBS 962.96) TaxID=1314807 RepID=A0A4S8M823_DENBC|nr:hypothetical protein K435DRAFT_838113 [Dendrothele bispora CBS 962.96]
MDEIFCNLVPVYILFILNLTQTLVTTSFAWDLLVAGWGKPEALASVPWSGAVHLALTGLKIIWVQKLYVGLTQFISVIIDSTQTKALLGEIWLIGSFVADILIAVVMIAITVETGSLTAITAGVDLILFLKSPGNYLFLCPSLILGKLYTNAVVARLNSRRSSQSPHSTGMNVELGSQPSQQFEIHHLVQRNRGITQSEERDHPYLK